MHPLLLAARRLATSRQAHAGRQFWTFVARASRQYRLARYWADLLHSDAALAAWLDADPTLLIKPLRPYLACSVETAQRMQWLEAHYRWMSKHLPIDLLEHLRNGHSLTLCRFTDAQGR
ncbi:DUF535 family protein, partial [Chitinimonas sp.]|uniref:DUF535 family protein n=1 Tax=Chitinimonas sp. TaxID=1934313 RepID=UPI0035B10367